MEIASIQVYEAMIRTGRIQDFEGHAGDNGIYQYRFQYPMTVDGEDYYIFAEMHMDETGGSIHTGSSYAVHVYDNICYKLKIDENNNYSIVEIL